MIIKDVKKVAIIAGAVAAATVAGTVSAVLIKKHKKAKDEDLEIDDEEDFDIEDDEDFDIEDDEEDFDIEDDDEDFDIEDDVDEEGFEIPNDKENTCTEGKSEVVAPTEDKEDKAVSCEDVKKVLNHLGIKDEKFINNIIGVGEGVEKAAYNTAKVSKAVAVKTLKKVLKVLEAED